MTRALPQEQRSSPLDAVPAVWLAAVVVLLAVIALVVSTALASSQAAAEAAAAGEESSFELDDMYETWSWIIVFGTFATVMVYGLKKGWPFATVVQITLIITLIVCFILISQQVDRDIFGVGVYALIVLTLVQIAFGNISPLANLRQSLTGVVIAAIIISVVVGLSIWLVPSMIRLGR